jgi:hypothetical protein
MSNFKDESVNPPHKATDRSSVEKSEGEYTFWEAPAVLESIKAGEFPFLEFFSESEKSEMDELLSGVISLIILRRLGNEIAARQLSIVHKFIFPKKYGVNKTVIERLSEKYESGHLTRGWKIRKLMYSLSELVGPTDPTKDILTSPVKLLPQADRKHPLYEDVVKILSRKKRSTTLQMLAVRVFMERNEYAEDGGGINERSLMRDLQKVREWEEVDHEHMRLKKELIAAGPKVSWKARIPIRKYSESVIPMVSEDIQSSRDEIMNTTRANRKRKSKKHPL